MNRIDPAAVTRRTVIGGLAFGGACALFGGTATATPAGKAQDLRSGAATTANVFVVPAATIIPLEGAWFGAFVKPDPTNTPGVSEPEVLEAVTGRTLGIDHSFHHWATPFPQARIDDDIARGRIPLLSWGAGPWATLQATAAGENDEAVRVQARTLRAVGQPVLMRYTWEMDLPQRGYEDPAVFRQAWQRVRAIFREEGADNVAFVFCPTWYGYQTGEASQLWPGDADVDWIGVDYYARPTNGYGRLAEFLDPFYDFGVRHGHPMIVCETGVYDPGGSTQADWLAQVQVDLAVRYPLVGGLVYFDMPGEGDTDWVIEGNAATEQAARDLAAAAYFRPFADGIRDLALGAVATASTEFSSNVAARAIDGNRVTRWISKTEPAPVLQIDLARPGDLIELRLRTGVVGSTAYRVRAFEVQALVDGSWQGIGAISGNAAEKVVLPLAAPRGVRTLRIVFTEPSPVDDMARVFEVQVLGRETS